MPNWSHISAKFSDSTYVQEIADCLEEDCRPAISDLCVSDDDLSIWFEFPWTAPVDEIRDIIVAYPMVEMEFEWHEANMGVFGSIYAPGDGTALILVLSGQVPFFSEDEESFFNNPENYARTNTDGRAERLV